MSGEMLTDSADIVTGDRTRQWRLKNFGLVAVFADESRIH
jgi:hypothetical protein